MAREGKGSGTDGARPQTKALGRKGATRRERAETLDVTSGVIWRQLLALSLPIIVSTLFQQFDNLESAWVLGQFAGKEALGGIQSCLIIGDFCISFAVGVSAGCTVIAGQYFGAGDHRRLGLAVHTAMALALIVGTVFAVGGVASLEPVLELMSTPRELMDEALAFGRAYFSSMLFSLVYNMGAALLRAVGDSKSPSRILIFACIINAILDITFVAVLRMGAIGCGLATAITTTTAAVLVCRRLMLVKADWHLRLSQVRVTRQIVGPMFRAGMPLGIQSSVYTISNVIVLASINTFGADAATGWGLSRRIDTLVWLCSDALGMAVTTFAAQNFGAGNHERMHRSLRTSLMLTAVIIGGLSALLYACVPQLTALFISDASVIGATTYMLRFGAPFYVVYSLLDNIGGVIRGAGESVGPMLITIAGTCVFRVVWLLAVVPIWHTVDMVLVSFPVTWFLTCALFVVYYRRGTWLARAERRRGTVLGEPAAEAE